MTEIFDFGRHTPYILAAYGVSVFAIVALIIWRREQLKKTLAGERSDPEKT